MRIGRSAMGSVTVVMAFLFGLGLAFLVGLRLLVEILSRLFG